MTYVDLAAPEPHVIAPAGAYGKETPWENALRIVSVELTIRRVINKLPTSKEDNRRYLIDMLYRLEKIRRVMRQVFTWKSPSRVGVSPSQQREGDKKYYEEALADYVCGVEPGKLIQLRLDQLGDLLYPRTVEVRRYEDSATVAVVEPTLPAAQAAREFSGDPEFRSLWDQCVKISNLGNGERLGVEGLEYPQYF